MPPKMNDVIDQCFARDENIDLSVNSRDDVVYALAKIYTISMERVCIYTDDLRGDIFDDGVVCDSLLSFLTRESSRSLRIIVKNPISVGSALGGELLNAARLQRSEIRKKIELYVASNKFASIIGECNSNFSVSDGKRYRLSEKVKGIERLLGKELGTIGIVNANDIETSRRLEELFVRLLRGCEPVPVEIENAA